jgi:hypothetical protein
LNFGKAGRNKRSGPDEIKWNNCTEDNEKDIKPKQNIEPVSLQKLIIFIHT